MKSENLQFISFGESCRHQLNKTSITIECFTWNLKIINETNLIFLFLILIIILQQLFMNSETCKISTTMYLENETLKFALISCENTKK